MNLQDSEKNRFSQRMFFVFALVFHLAIYAYYLYPAIFGSKAPVEPDDAYAYIHKTEALFHCQPLTSCPAYGSLLEQAKASTAETWFKDRYTGRIFCNYSLLHSLALKAARFFSGNWEAAYSVLIVAGGLFLVFSFALLLYGIFGLATTSLWLLFFTSIKYRGAGWQYIVPANLSAGFAALSWYFLLKKGGKRSLAAAAVLSGLAVLTHSIGLVYSGIGFALLFFSFYQQQRVNWFSCLLFPLPTVLAKLFVGYFQIPGLECSFGAHLGFDPKNFAMGARIIGQWLVQQPGSVPFGILFTLLGLWSIPSSQRWNTAALVGALATVFFVSLFHILPGYPGELAIRILLPLGLLLSGFVAAGIIYFFYFLRRQQREQLHWRRVLLFALMLGLFVEGGRLFALGIWGGPTSWRSLRFWQNAITRPPNLYWESSQAQFLLKNTDASSLIAFDGEINLYKALAEGLSERRVLFLPFLSPAPSMPISYYVLTSPVQPALLGSQPLEILSSAKGQPPTLELYLENRSFQQALLAVEGSGKRELIRISSREERRARIPLLPAGNTKLTLTELSGANLVLKGIDAGQGDSLHWPWNRGFELRYGGQSFPVKSDLVPCKPECQVVADGGYSLVMQPKPPSKQAH